MADSVVVLGAGLAGLSFAYHYGNSVAVYEKELEPGGIVRTIAQGPYRFDLAPHLLHIRSPEITDLVTNKLGLSLNKHQRRSKIYIGGVVIPYPFELNLKQVPEHIRNECLDGLNQIELHDRNNEAMLRSGSYGEYVMKAFGPGIAKHYLLPYNRKIWDTNPYEMTCEWMRFLPTAEIDQIRKNAFEENNDEFGYNTVFYYPAQRGISDLSNAFAENIPRLKLGNEAISIDPELRIVRFSTGREVSYNTLVSTMPLNDLARLVGNDQMELLAADLLFTSVYVVNVVIRGKVPDDTHWMYFPDTDLSFYRISFPKAYSNLCAPDGEHIIVVEIGSRRHDLEFAPLEKKVVEELKQLEIFEIDEIIRIHTECLRTAYVIYDKQRTERVTALHGLLWEKNILSIGRYGNWEYAAMEDAIVQGRDAALMLKAQQ